MVQFNLARNKLNGQIIHIDSVLPTNRLLRDNCECFTCGSKVEAVLEFKNSNRHPFFRHSNKVCNGGVETALHLLAKQIIAENDQILIKGKGVVNYKYPRIHLDLGNFESDITVSYDDKDLNFEIKVTHAVNSSKANFYRENDLRCVEIDLSNVQIDASLEEIRSSILTTPSNQKIIHWDKNTNESNWICKIIFIIIGVGLTRCALRLLVKSSKRTKSTLKRFSKRSKY